MATETPVPTGEQWIHGTRLGREHRSVRTHLVEDHRVDPGWVENASDAQIHGKHDGQHSKTFADSLNLPHPASFQQITERSFR